MAVEQLVWERGCCSEPQAKTGARAGSVTIEGQTKSPLPSNSCTQSLGLQEPQGWGAPTPASPEPDSSNSLLTQEKIKTDGAAPVSLMNETRPGRAA